MYIEALNALCHVEVAQGLVDEVAVNEVVDLVHEGDDGDDGNMAGQVGEENEGGGDAGDGNMKGQFGGEHAGGGGDEGGGDEGGGDEGAGEDFVHEGDGSMGGQVGEENEGGGDQGGGDAGDEVEEETLESLGEIHGPLAISHFPKASVIISNYMKKDESDVVSIHPWRSDLFDPNNTVRYPIPENYDRITTGRREAVSLAYRIGKMYAILKSGEIVMSPDNDIQVCLDAQNKARGRSITVAAWLDLVFKTIIRVKAAQDRRKASIGTKRKYKRKHKGEHKRKNKRKAKDCFNIEDASDEETEEE